MPDSLKSSFRRPKTLESAKVLPYQSESSTNSFVGIRWDDYDVRRLRLLLRDGRTLSIPYAYLPLFILVPNEGLTIKTTQLEVIIKGRGLARLEELLSQERVEWLRESNTEIDPGEKEFFIASIALDGKALL